VMAEAAYRDRVVQLPPTGPDSHTERAQHLASAVRFALDDPEAMRLLHGLIGQLRDLPRLELLLPRILDGALSLMAADFGSIRLLDPASGSLWLVTQSGFSPEFVDYFAVVDGQSGTGRAVHEGAQAIIADVDADADFLPHRDIAAASGFRALQSTPMTDYAGRLIGIVSTHFRHPYHPPARDLRIMELYGDFAGEAVARHLGLPASDVPADAIGRAVISSLLDPGDHQETSMTAVSRLDGHDNRHVLLPTSLDEVAFRFAGDVVNRLFSAGLSLESARSVVQDGPAADRLAAATREIDQAIRDIRAIIFGRTADRQGQPPDAALDR
jgi:hypothetical protein